MTVTEAGRLIRVATWCSAAVGGVLIAAKLAAWMATDSVALLSTLVDSVLDAVAAVVNLRALYHALHPSARRFRLGHRKVEPLAGLAQSAFIAGSALFLFSEAGKRLLSPEPVSAAPIGIAVMGLSVVLTLALALFQRFVIRRTGAPAIGTDHLHYTGDLAMNASVILALILAGQFGFSWADPLFAVAIAGFMAYSAAAIGRQSLRLLMDHEFAEADRDRVAALCRSHPDVIGIRDLRTRSAGRRSSVRVRLDLPPDLTLRRARDIGDEVRAAILEAYPGLSVTIHPDPSPEDPPRLSGR
ncbi:MAG: cation diffusion facilitator family transporter [Telmatospirillum sp.]|nr:cation diffusion facilitator family transporter [Telmatospirillum sp.]